MMVCVCAGLLLLCRSKKERKGVDVQKVRNGNTCCYFTIEQCTCTDDAIATDARIPFVC
jgi:hypothetical protein